MTKQEQHYLAHLEGSLKGKINDAKQLRGEIDALNDAISAFKQIVVNDSMKFGVDKDLPKV